MGSFAQQLRLPLPVGRLKILVIATAMSAFFALLMNKITAYNSVTLFLNRFLARSSMACFNLFLAK